MDMRAEGNGACELLQTYASGEGLRIAEGRREIQTNDTAVRGQTLFDSRCDRIHGDEAEAGCFRRTVDGTDQHQVRRTEHDDGK